MRENGNEFLRRKPGKRKIRFDFISLSFPVLAILVGLLLFAQTYAGSVGYDKNLSGRPLFLSPSPLPFSGPLMEQDGKKGYPYYNGALCFLYILSHPFEKGVQHAFYRGLFPLSLSVIFAAFLFFILSFLRLRGPGAENLYGSARWGKEKDLRKFGLSEKEGVILAEEASAKVGFTVNPENSSVSLRLEREAPFVCHAGGTNTLMIAPTRSGKGVSSVIPTCLSYPQSMIIYDPKGELWEATAGFRSQFSHCLKFSPLSHDTIRFNPLLEVDRGERAFADIGLILSIIFQDSSGAKGGDDNAAFFRDSARDFLQGFILHVLTSGLYGEEDQNLSGILSILSKAAAVTTDALGNETGAADGLLHEMIDNDHYDKNGSASSSFQDIIQGSASRCLGMNPKVRQDVFSTIFSKLALFQDPYIAYVTGGSDFALDDFYESPSPLSLYLTVPWSDIERIAPIFKLLINFILNKFSRGEAGYGGAGDKGGGKKLKNRILFLIDEFPTLGYFPFIAQSMGILAGYGITFYIIVQALNQLVDKYGANHSFLDNCKTVCLFAPGKIEDARLFSEMVGKESVVKESVSSSGYRFSLGLNNLNASSQEIARNLINPDELMKLPPSDALIYNQGMPPYMAKKVVYYMDRRFKERLCFKAPGTRSELLKEASGLPSRKGKEKR
jgi:type IV secretion system protein VirD4